MASAGKDFYEPLCGCFNDMGSCLIASFVPCGLCYLQAKAVDTMQGDGMTTPCLLYGCLCTIGAALNRGKIRFKLDYDGSFLGDCCIHAFCDCCATLQEYRESQKQNQKTK